MKNKDSGKFERKTCWPCGHTGIPGEGKPLFHDSTVEDGAVILPFEQFALNAVSRLGLMPAHAVIYRVIGALQLRESVRHVGH